MFERRRPDRYDDGRRPGNGGKRRIGRHARPNAFAIKTQGRGKSFAADSKFRGEWFLEDTPNRKFQAVAAGRLDDDQQFRMAPGVARPGRRSDKLAVALPVQPVPRARDRPVAMFRMIKNIVAAARTRPEQQDGQERQREPH